MIEALANIAPKSDYEAIQAVIAHLSATGAEEADLERVAARLRTSSRALTALFRRWCGLTPKQFAQAVALDHAKRLLSQSASMLETSLEVGYSSPARLYDLFVTHEAMPPGAWAKGGAGLTLVWGVAESPFGNALLILSDYGLAGLAFFDGNDPAHALADMEARWPNAGFTRDDTRIAPEAARIFEPGKWSVHDPIRVVLIGTDFEVRVWQSLLDIPLGAAGTYGDIAHKLGKPTAARAVGAAVGRNPVSFVVPCHRVVGSTGKLTGYHWGLNRKRAMLGWEQGVRMRAREEA